MTTATEVQTTQVYNIVIKTTPEALWEAITKPEFTERYFYGARIRSSTTGWKAHRRRRPPSPGVDWMTVLSGLKTLLETGKPLA
jgi:uncharacterized protein YndB with AHSA1/START domain